MGGGEKVGTGPFSRWAFRWMLQWIIQTPIESGPSALQITQHADDGLPAAVEAAVRGAALLPHALRRASLH